MTVYAFLLVGYAVEAIIIRVMFSFGIQFRITLNASLALPLNWSFGFLFDTFFGVLRLFARVTFGFFGAFGGGVQRGNFSHNSR